MNTVPSELCSLGTVFGSLTDPFSFNELRYFTAAKNLYSSLVGKPVTHMVFPPTSTEWFLRNMTQILSCEFTNKNLSPSGWGSGSSTAIQSHKAGVAVIFHSSTPFAIGYANGGGSCVYYVQDELVDAFKAISDSRFGNNIKGISEYTGRIYG